MELSLEHIAQAPEKTSVVQSSWGTRDLLCLNIGAGLTVLHRDGREPFQWTLSERKGGRVGTAAFLHASTGIGYVALDDHKSNTHLAVFDTRLSWAHAFCGFIDCKFGRSSVRAVVGVRTGLRAASEIANVVVVSSSGKIAILRCTDKAGTESCDAVVPYMADLCGGRLVGVDSSVPGFCAIAQLERKHVAIHILEVDEELCGQMPKQDLENKGDAVVPIAEPAPSINAVMWQTLWAPNSPKNDAAPIGFAILPDAAFILYSGGTLRIFWPHGRAVEGEDRVSLNRWRPASSPRNMLSSGTTSPADDSGDEEGPKKKRKCTVIHSVKYEILLLASTKDSSKNSSGEKSRVSGDGSSVNEPRRGGIVSVGGGYVMVGYGSILSVWDGIYGVGHGFVELPGEIKSICAGSSEGEVVAFLTNGSLFSIALNLDEESEGLNLGSALKRQHSCVTITAFQSNDAIPTKSPLHVQPVALSILKATADAGGSAPQLFANFFKVENKDEMRRVRRVLDRFATPTAKDVSDTVARYIFGNKATRRLRKWASRSPALLDDIAQRPSHRLDWLPSERLAATVVARCLRELHSDQLSFLIPLIDILWSGVVCADFVLAVTSELNSVPVGDKVFPVSLTAPLVRAISTSGALEAMLLRVADLPELDVVRMIQFSLRTLATSRDGLLMNGVSNLPGTEEGDWTLSCAHRCHRLLGRCISRPVDETQVTAALQRIPLQDVLAFLHYLKRILTDNDMAELLCFPGVRGEEGTREGDLETPADYRGADSWLDEPVFKGESTIKACTLIQQVCLDWIGRVSAVHLTTLIMDDRGTKMLEALLEVVRARKAQAQRAAPLLGILQHVREKKPLPTDEDPLYTVTRVQIAKFSALT